MREARPNTVGSFVDFAQVFPEAELIQNAELRSKVLRLWSTLWERSNWQHLDDVPVSIHIETSQVAHTKAVTAMAIALADIIIEVHGVEIDRDLLVAAALVQDATKVLEYEFDDDGNMRRSRAGRVLGHGVLGVATALELELPLEIANVILSHSPGSALAMDTLEAKILAYADQIDVAALGGDRFVEKVVRYR